MLTAEVGNGRVLVVQNQDDQIDAAFEILLEELEDAVNVRQKEDLLAAHDARDFAAARKLIDEAEALTSLRQEVDRLRRDWSKIKKSSHSPSRRRERPQPTSPARLDRGVRTPEDAYYAPILRALIEAGGRATVRETLDRVMQLMKTELKEVDFQPLPSDPDEQRWRNTAKWARNTMVQDGRLIAGSKYGTWEIADEGRKWLMKATKSPTQQTLE